MNFGLNFGLSFVFGDRGFYLKLFCSRSTIAFGCQLLLLERELAP
jgi:hypothetical protein